MYKYFLKNLNWIHKYINNVIGTFIKYFVLMIIFFFSNINVFQKLLVQKRSEFRRICLQILLVIWILCRIFYIRNLVKHWYVGYLRSKIAAKICCSIVQNIINWLIFSIFFLFLFILHLYCVIFAIFWHFRLFGYYYAPFFANFCIKKQENSLNTQGMQCHWRLEEEEDVSGGRCWLANEKKGSQQNQEQNNKNINKNKAMYMSSYSNLLLLL